MGALVASTDPDKLTETALLCSNICDGVMIFGKEAIDEESLFNDPMSCLLDLEADDEEELLSDFETLFVWLLNILDV